MVAEHARLADFFLRRENWEQAMRHFLEAEEFDLAARVIAERGQVDHVGRARQPGRFIRRAPGRGDGAPSPRAYLPRGSGAIARRIRQGAGHAPPRHSYVEGQAIAKARPKRCTRWPQSRADMAISQRLRIPRPCNRVERRATAVRAKCGNTRGDACWRWANGLKRSANSALHCNWPRRARRALRALDCS